MWPIERNVLSTAGVRHFKADNMAMSFDCLQNATKPHRLLHGQASLMELCQFQPMEAAAPQMSQFTDFPSNFDAASEVLTGDFPPGVGLTPGVGVRLAAVGFVGTGRPLDDPCGNC